MKMQTPIVWKGCAVNNAFSFQVKFPLHLQRIYRTVIWNLDPNMTFTIYRVFCTTQKSHFFSFYTFMRFQKGVIWNETSFRIV